MTPSDILHEAETDLAALANLPGEIRGKVKAGVAELTRIRDAIDATLAALTGSARATLASLEALARTPEAEPAGSAPDTAPAAGSFAA